MGGGLQSCSDDAEEAITVRTSQGAQLGKWLSLISLLVAHYRDGVPLLYSSGAPVLGAPLISELPVAHLGWGAPLLFFWLGPALPRLTSGAPEPGAPLLF